MIGVPRPLSSHFLRSCAQMLAVDLGNAEID